MYIGKLKLKLKPTFDPPPGVSFLERVTGSRQGGCLPALDLLDRWLFSGHETVAGRLQEGDRSARQMEADACCR